MELYPPSKDAVIGPSRVEDLARVYALVGEPDRALDEIEDLLAIPSGFSVKLLEIDPDWDPLREHPRYREILQEFGR